MTTTVYDVLIFVWSESCLLAKPLESGGGDPLGEGKCILLAPSILLLVEWLPAVKQVLN